MPDGVLFTCSPLSQGDLVGISGQTPIPTVGYLRLRRPDRDAARPDRPYRAAAVGAGRRGVAVEVACECRASAGNIRVAAAAAPARCSAAYPGLHRSCRAE